MIFARGAATIISGIETRPTDPLIPAFATVLRRRREALHLSQKALSRRAGISTVFVGRIESTRNQPTIRRDRVIPVFSASAFMQLVTVFMAPPGPRQA